jgi:hypothetical protein
MTLRVASYQNESVAGLQLVYPPSLFLVYNKLRKILSIQQYKRH